EGRIKLRLLRNEIEKVPLGHHRNEGRSDGQMLQCRDRVALPEQIERHRVELRVRFLEQFLKQADLVKQLERRGMDRVAAKIAEEIGMFFEHYHLHPGTREEEPCNHAGRPPAHDDDRRVSGQRWLHPGAGAFSRRASGMISRMREQKCLRQTSFSLSGPTLKLRDCMPCWTRVIRAVSSAFT